MDDRRTTLGVFFEGWHNYQNLLTTSLAALTPAQFDLRPAPALRSLGETVLHMIGARSRWFHAALGEGNEEFAAFGSWDRPGQQARSSAEMAVALDMTWRVMHEAIARWTPDQWVQCYDNDPGDEPSTFTRQWVVWHLIEHDLHHGGEFALGLGQHGLIAPDL